MTFFEKYSALDSKSAKIIHSQLTPNHIRHKMPGVVQEQVTFPKWIGNNNYNELLASTLIVVTPVSNKFNYNSMFYHLWK